ncbi:MAG: DUF2169 domain-containing protein [Myxococcales bacterium]|nr:DUF2169 domain-containing protein [Myxococcales bacterium]
MARQPIRETYDAHLDLWMDGDAAEHAHAFVKQRFVLGPRGLELAEAAPLALDAMDPESPAPFTVGGDGFRNKQFTDVIVVGDAFAPGGQPTRESEVRVRVGRDVAKRVKVFGPRYVEGPPGAPRFSAPEPFESVPLDLHQAYGGVDPRAVDPDFVAPEGLELRFDGPGFYPRNPFGRGYVLHEREEPFALPQLEDPSDLLTPERLFVRDPRAWWRQPRPAALGWMPANVFPRCIYFFPGTDAWFPGPEDGSLPEIRDRVLAPGYRTLRAAADAPLIHTNFYQEAPPELTFAELPPGVPIVAEGMHPDGPIGFRLPAPPKVEMFFDGRVERAPTRLHHVVYFASRNEVTVTYGASMALGRPVIPGVHAHIPLAMRVEGDRPIEYETPTPKREILRAVMEAHAGTT